MTDFRDLPPVEENIDRPEKLSQSFLAHADVCARSAFLYQRHRSGPTSHAMDRGSVFHEVAERFIEALVQQDENEAPPEVAKDLLEEVILQHPELQIPAHEHEALRIMVHHLAEHLWIEPSQVVAVEKMLELDLDGVVIRGKVDFAAIDLASRTATIYDWKTQWPPADISTQAQFEGTFQTKFYALLLAEGKGADDPVPIGRDLETIKVAEVFPRGKGMPHREAILSREKLLDFKRDVQATIARAEHGFSTGKWQAVPGDHCDRCPARHECPLPAELIPAAFPDDDVEALGQRWLFLSSEAAAVKRRIRSWAKDNGGRVSLGGNLELAFKVQVSRSVKDVNAVIGLLESQGLDVEDYISTSTSTPFEKRKVKP